MRGKAAAAAAEASAKAKAAIETGDAELAAEAALECQQGKSLFDTHTMSGLW